MKCTYHVSIPLRGSWISRSKTVPDCYVLTTEAASCLSENVQASQPVWYLLSPSTRYPVACLSFLTRLFKVAFMEGDRAHGQMRVVPSCPGSPVMR